ncbi:MAG: MBG domain-containing protein, partial [Verrucomicrobiota bacterium]
MAALAPAATFAGQQLHGHVPAAVAALRPVERLPAAQHLHLAMSLPARNPAELKILIDDLYDPASPNFRHYLTPAQFTEKFGPTEADYQTVVDFARANGLKVTATHPNRLLLEVDGAIPAIESAFHVTLRNYQHPQEARKFYAPDTEPALDLAVPIASISGLDNYWIPHPNHKIKPLNATANVTPNAGSGPGGAYGGGDFRAAYVPGTALTGAGQSVGLLQFDGYYASDIAAYKTQFGLPDVPLVNVAVNGGVSTPGTGNSEVCLDIEMVLAMAPGVSAIYVYEAPNTTSNFLPLLNRMVSDNLCKQISCSWGGGTNNAESIFQQMATQGQSFFNATGDSDAFTGTIPFPSDSPSITEVGATTLSTTGAGGSYVSETVWNWGLVSGSYVGSSGGSSTIYAIPSWQQSTSMATNQGSATRRNLPDVALTGDNVYVRYNNGASGAFGGTSCAAPLWAGFTALVNQQALANGRATVGFLNPAIYALGTGASYSSTFHDTTTGNNFWPTSPTKFAAVAGYDLCTGWGTPAGIAMINALAGTPEYLQVSMPAFAPGGPVGGPFSPGSASCTLTNSGTTALSWTAAKTQSWTTLSTGSGTLAAGANTIVTWSINSGASALAAGTYADTLTFTDVGTGIGQGQTLNLAVTGTPTNLVATPGNNAAKLTWSAAGGASAYNVKRALVSGGPYATVGTTSTTSYMDATATNGSTYFYVVSATNGSVESSNSGEASVIPAALPSTTSLASSLGATGAYGSAVTFSATVAGTGATASGTVTFKDGSTVLGSASLNASGVAAFTTSALGLGGHALSASFPGDVTYAASTSATFGYTVSPKPVTITGVSAANKIYDATTSAVLSGGVVSGLVGSDAVSVVAGSGNFASANAGTQAVSSVGYALSGANAANYVLSAQPAVANATITPRPVQLSGTQPYDGSMLAAATVLSVLNNLDGTNLTLTGSANLAGSNVGVQAVSTGAAVARVQSATGNTGSNAATSFGVTLATTPTSGNTLIAVISTRGTSTSRVTSITQTGATWVRAAQTANSSGTTTEIWYAPSVAGAGTSLTISQASLRSAAVVIEYAGILAAGVLDQTASATGSSTAAATGTTLTTGQANEVWLGGIGFVSSTPTLSSVLGSFTTVASAQSTRSTASSNAKVYALERIVSSTGAATTGGTLSASAQWSGTICTFKTVRSSTLALAGAAAANYTTVGATGSVLVTPRPVTVTAVSATKTYDGTTSAAGTPTLSPPLLGSDTASVLAQAFQTPAAGAGNKVIIPSILINDTNGGANYAPTLVNCNSGTILPAPAGLTLGGFTATYDGSPKPITAVTSPVGLSVAVTYNASTTVPGAAGTYTIAATVSDPNYSGSASGTLVIQKATATIGLTGLSQTYDGSPRPVTTATTPTGLTVAVTYDGSPTAPSAAGSYAIAASVTDPNHTGSAAGTLVIDKATATIGLTGLSQTYDGTPKPVTAATTPIGLTVAVTYDGSPTVPSAAGSYAIAASVTDPNH